jgi:hypothetical protein
MVRPEENLFTYVGDKTMSLHELQRFVNRVAGRIRRRLPGVILSASLKVKTCAQEKETNPAGCGSRLSPFNSWYEDSALIAAGGDADGWLSMHQLQFYPENAFGIESSPFEFSLADFAKLHNVRPLGRTRIDVPDRPLGPSLAAACVGMKSLLIWHAFSCTAGVREANPSRRVPSVWSHCNPQPPEHCAHGRGGARAAMGRGIRWGCPTVESNPQVAAREVWLFALMSVLMVLRASLVVRVQAFFGKGTTTSMGHRRKSMTPLQRFAPS